VLSTINDERNVSFHIIYLISNSEKMRDLK
jgi:hypothetical protein